jgi:uncharacterized protein with FMN-binding domain
MKPSRAVVLAAMSLGVLAAGWKAGLAPVGGVALADSAAGGVTPAPAPTTSSAPTATTTTQPTTTTTATTTPAPPPPPAGPTGTFVGPSVQTAYGAMQVQIIVSNGTITAVQPLVIGYGDRTSTQINTQAVPVLEQRVLSAQSASVSYVSGASYTSQGYLASVAGAMSSAGI